MPGLNLNKLALMKNYIVVTGGAGFVGSNLIEYILNISKNKIISLDNYSSGSKKNHIKDQRVKYIRGDCINIKKIINLLITLFTFFLFFIHHKHSLRY